MLKRWQLAGANYAYTKHTFAYFIESMQRLGFTHIEVYAASPHLYPYDCDRPAVRAVKRQLEAAGIQPVCLTAEQCMIPVSLSIDDPTVQARSLDYYMRALEQASELEVPYMHLVAGGGYIESNPESDYRRAIDGIGKVSDRAKALGLRIALEADRGTPIRNTSDVRKVIDTIGCDRVQGLLDTNAVWHAKEDFEEAVILLGEDLAHMHFIDLGPQGGCLTPGDGELPLAQYLEVLDRHGYRGFMTPELWGFRYLNEAEAAMRRGRDFCHRYMEP